jgi:hypothetical protein
VYYAVRRWRRLQAPMTAITLLLWIAAAGWIQWVYLAQ